MPVEAALADLAQRELPSRPDPPGVELAVGLEHRHRPRAHPELDRPVQRRRSTISDRPRMDDQAPIPRPDRLRNHPLQERAHDQPRLVLSDRGFHLGVGVDHRDRHVMPQLGQRDPRALAQAVVRRDQEQNAAPPRGSWLALPVCGDAVGSDCCPARSRLIPKRSLPAARRPGIVVPPRSFAGGRLARCGRTPRPRSGARLPRRWLASRWRN